MNGNGNGGNGNNNIIPASWPYGPPGQAGQAVMTPEEVLAQQLGTYPLPNVGTRALAPEESNADLVRFSADAWQRLAVGVLPPVLEIDGSIQLKTPDYSSLSNIQYLRAARTVLDSLGRADQSEIAFDWTGEQWEATAFSDNNLWLGVLIQWGVQNIAATRFTLGVTTENFVGECGQVLDRNFTVMVGGSPRRRLDQANEAGPSPGTGGTFAVLFANRETVTYASYYASNPALNRAIIQPARLGFDQVKADGEDTPTIVLTVPASLSDAFSASAQPITAGSNALAMLMDAVYADQVGRGLR
jgi:hypothetical protein